MVINPIVGVYIPIIRIPIKRWDDHPQYCDFWPWHIWVRCFIQAEGEFIWVLNEGAFHRCPRRRLAWGLVETRRTFLSYDEFNGEDGLEFYSHGPRESISESQVCTSSVPRTAKVFRRTCSPKCGKLRTGSSVWRWSVAVVGIQSLSCQRPMATATSEAPWRCGADQARQTELHKGERWGGSCECTVQSASNMDRPCARNLHLKNECTASRVAHNVVVRHSLSRWRSYLQDWKNFSARIFFKAMRHCRKHLRLYPVSILMEQRDSLRLIPYRFIPRLLAFCPLDTKIVHRLIPIKDRVSLNTYVKSGPEEILCKPKRNCLTI